MFDDLPPKRVAPHEVGMVLDTLSVDELEKRIGLLEAEIERLRGAIRDRQATRSQAEQLFKL